MLTFDKLIRSYNQIRYCFIKELNKRMEFNNFAPNEISIMLALGNNKNIKTASELSTLLMVSKGLVSRSIDALYTKDLIILSKNDNDKRIIELNLSDKGLDIVSKMNETMVEINNEFRALFNDEELSGLNKAVDKILEYFKEGENNE